MSRLSECLPQHREALEASGIDTDRLVARAIELRELDGLDPQIAAMTAVEEMLNQQDAALGELVGDLRERGAQLDDEGRELFQEAAPEPTPEPRHVTLEQAQASLHDVRNYQPPRTKDGKYIGVPETVTSPNGLRALRNLVRKLTVEGAPGRFWYEDSAQRILQIANGDVVLAEKIVQLVAVYSPQNAIAPNMGQAIKAYSLWREGVPREHFHVRPFGSSGKETLDDKAIAVLYDNARWEGRKTNSFYLNLMHEIVQGATPEQLESMQLTGELSGVSSLAKDGVTLLDDINRAVTVDMWVRRAFGYRNDATGDDRGTGQYSFQENELMRLAYHLNAALSPGERPWLPHQVQAALWTAAKARWEDQSVRASTIRKSVKSGLSRYVPKVDRKTREPVLDEQGAPVMVWELPKNAKDLGAHRLLWRKHALALNDAVAAENVATSKMSFADVIGRMTEQVTWEALPSEKLGWGIGSATPEVIAQFTREARGLLLDDAGNDRLAEEVGGYLNWAEFGTGAYAGHLTPNIVTSLVPVKPNGAFSRAEVELYARAIQYIYQQDAVPWFRADAQLKVDASYLVRNEKGRTLRRFATQAEAQDFADKKEGRTVGGDAVARGIRLEFNHDLSRADEEAFFDAIREAIGADAGYTRTSPSEIVVINYRGEDGLPFMDDEAFVANLERLDAEQGEALGIEDLVRFWAEGDYGYEHDWSKDPAGEGVLQGSLAGRSDLHPWLRDRRKAFEELLQAYEAHPEEHGDAGRELYQNVTTQAGRDRAREEISQFAGGIPAPEWVSSDDAGNNRPDPSRDSSYLGELGDDAASAGRVSGTSRGVGRGAGRALGAGPRGRGTGRGRSGTVSLFQAGISEERGAPRLPELESRSPGGNLVAQRAAAEYMASVGRPYQPQAEYVRVDIERAERIAAAYEAMAHAPNDPAVQAAYRALIDQTVAQYQFVKATGIKLEAITEDMAAPYPEGPRQVLLDIRDNNHMWFYPTDLGFGSDATFDPADNMLMELTDEFIDGKQLRANDVFRIVHDYFGHSVEGALFRGRGEENAWQSHIRLYFDEAVGAATSETRGQNSWLNYGPYGETNRTARTEDTVFADQKMGLMPEWTWTEGVAPAAPEQPTELNQPARGRIELPAGTLGTGPATIELLENADLSTFLHESGHFFLEAYRHLIESGQANERVRNDWQSILRWLGVEHGDQIATEHHEQWARAFEAYLLEGKAPSPELQVAFARFRAWLVRIYRSITNLDVELTDEVRGVMDRMLATEQEINAVEDQMAYRDLFSEDEQAGMSNRDKEAYRRLVAQANDEAKSRLEKKLFEEMRREESRWWRDEVEKVLEEVEADVNAQPIYQAWHFLSRGEALVGELPDEVVRDGPFKLSKEAIIDGWGKDALERMPGRGRFGVYQAKGGVHPDVAADLFGLSSGDALVQALIAAPSRETVIKAQAQSVMRERHGEMMSDGTMREAALDAVHSDARVRLLERELQVLSKRSGGTPTPRQTAQALAEQTIAAKPVRDAQRANAYAQAEARAGRLAERALLKGDVAEAARQKRNQLIQHHLFRAARRANDEVEMFQRRVTRLGRAGTRKNIAASYLAQIDGILEQYDFKRVSDRAIAERQALAQFVAERLEAGDEVTIPDHVLHRAQRKHFSTLSVEEFRGVRDAIVNLEHLGRLKNKLQLNKERRDFEAVVDELVAGVDPRLPRTEVVPDFTPTWRKRFGKGAREFFAWHMKLEFMFEALDGDVAGGAWWRHMFKPLADAEVREQEMMARVNGELGALFDRYSRAERARWARKIQTNIGEFNKSSLLALALNWGNQENIDAVIDGYGWDYDSVFDTLNQHLDQRDWEFVQGVWDLVDSLWPDIKALQERLSGVAPTKVQATPIDTRFGSFAGGYYPLKYDSELSWVAFKRDRKAETEELFGSEYLRPSTRQGHTKERVGSGGQPVLLDLSVLTNHIANVVHDLTHREALVYVDKLASDPSVRGAVEQTMGREAYRQIRPWLANIASDRTDPSDRLEHVLGYARAGATIANMGLKLTTAIVQPLGYLQSVEVIGEKWAWRGLSQFFAAPRQMKQRIDFVLERSTMMRERQKTFDRDVRDQLRKIKKGRLYEVQQSFFALIGLLDMAVSVPTWLGAYERGLHDFHGDEQKAVDYADRSVRVSQSAGGAKDLAQIQQGSNYRRIFVMFYSYFSVLHNLLRSRLRQTRGVRDIPRLATSFIYLIALPSVLAELITSRGPEDEEDYPLWLAQTIAGIPLATIVGVRDLANYVLRPEYGYGPSPAFDAVESAGSALLGLGKVAIGEKDWDKKVSKDVAMTLGYWGHLPARQAWVTGEYLYDWANGDIESFSPWELLVTGTRGDERE